MILIYRVSKGGYLKEKPNYINNINCLENAINTFNNGNIKWLIIADNLDELDLNISNKEILKVNIGHGAGTFNLALDYALKQNDEEIIYFLESDYLHKPGSYEILMDGFDLGVADYITLYDHPDKYINGINPYITENSEVTRVYLSKYCHWKLTNSTTMTFAAKVRTLKDDEIIIRGYTEGTHPNDFEMFNFLVQKKNKKLISPIPGFSTHGETRWLTPLYNWGNLIKK